MPKKPDQPKPEPKPKSKKIEVPVDEDLYEEATDYAKQHGVGLASILRAIMRIWFDPEDPRPLPPGVEDEKRRPRRKKDG